MTLLQSRIDRARWWAAQNQPFYGALAMRLEDAFDAPGILTAATNGRRIFWSSAFVESLSDAELRFVLLHETLHCAHQHLWRLPLTPPGNMAGDYAINLILQDVPGCKMPKGCLLDARYKGMAEEEILAQLPKKASYTDAAGGWTSPAEDARKDSALRDAWREAVIQAAQAAAAAQGDIPAAMVREIQRATVRQIDWRTAMAEFVRDAVSTRPDWSRPHRRSGAVLRPRVRHDAAGKIVLIRDTSGSVSEPELGLFNSAAEAILADTGASAVLLDADAKVQNEYRLDAGDMLPKSAAGGGGTDFRPALERAEQIAEDEAISGVVYITDMAGSSPDSCTLPVLWVSVSRGVAAPFGRIVEIGE